MNNRINYRQQKKQLDEMRQACKQLQHYLVIEDQKQKQIDEFNKNNKGCKHLNSSKEKECGKPPLWEKGMCEFHLNLYIYIKTGFSPRTPAT